MALTRQEANLLICKKIEEYCKNNPDIRFTQALFNLGINQFSADTLSKMMAGETPLENTLMDKYNEESVYTLQKL